jgi:hypothetical protein
MLLKSLIGIGFPRWRNSVPLSSRNAGDLAGCSVLYPSLPSLLHYREN